MGVAARRGSVHPGEVAERSDVYSANSGTHTRIRKRLGTLTGARAST